jgi:hypothetical protein
LILPKCPTQFEQANETSVQVDPTNSMHLELDQSLNNDDNNDLTIDEYAVIGNYIQLEIIHI